MQVSIQPFPPCPYIFPSAPVPISAKDSLLCFQFMKKSAMIVEPQPLDQPREAPEETICFRHQFQDPEGDVDVTQINRRSFSELRGFMPTCSYSTAILENSASKYQEQMSRHPPRCCLQ